MELDALKKTALDVAQAGGDTALRGFGKTKQIDFKSSHTDLVTEFDQLAQKVIVNILQARYPSHGILAEENLSTDLDADYVWVIDPIDGTTNYAHHSPIFCVSIGLLHQGEPIIGVVYAPRMLEMFVAVKGQGATLNGRPIETSKIEQLSQSVLATGFYYDETIIQKNLIYFGSLIHQSRAIRRLGSAALDMCWVAAGRFDAYWEMGLKPWDVTAGRIMITEAGGKISDFEGGKYEIDTHNLLCSNGRIHDQMMAALREA